MSAKYINMADYIAVKAAEARKLAITQLIVGFLLLCFGIGEQVLEELRTRDGYFGIWAGILVSRNVISCARGVLMCIERD